MAASWLLVMSLQRMYEMEERRPRSPPPPMILTGITPSPFEHDGWEDCGAYYKLRIHVDKLHSVDIEVDPDKHQLSLNAAIDIGIFATPATDVKTTIAFPADDLDETNIITDITGDDITVKVYKLDYDPPPLPPPAPKKRWFCAVQ